MTTAIYEGEIYTRTDINGEQVSIRVLFTAQPITSQHDDDIVPRFLYTDITILGVFRISNDAEVDFTLLHNNDQQKIEQKCEYEYNKEQDRKADKG